MHLRFMFLLGIVAMSAATGILADQIYFWVQDGTWYAYSLGDSLGSFGVRLPRIRVIVIKTLSDGMLGLPVSLILFVLGVLLAGIAFDAGEPVPDEATEIAVRRLRDYSR